MDEESNLAPEVSERTNAPPAEKRDLVPINQGRNLQTVPSAGKGAQALA